MSNFQGKVALVTGASRGIGASVAVMLAEGGANVAINYRSKRQRAEKVASAVSASGSQALLVQADLTSGSQLKQAIEQIKEKFDRLDLLILNASGGLEKDKSADYAMELNLTSQLRAVDLALPLIPSSGRIVFVTSHAAHFYGQKPVFPPMYEPVARSKKAGEEALRSRIPEFTNRGIQLIVVSGDLIEGTITPKLMQRQMPDLIELRRQQVGFVPTVEDFARAIVNAAADTKLKTGATIFVGSTHW
ncbi:MAG: SDR family oxidoreductase [Prochloraceae cyanobacterium]|nr:SDR family oxidoreductase [Prochloraceae cyanobacterium]